MTTPPTISEGTTGSTVRWAQYLLVRRTLSDNQIDGIFGPVTKAAVEQFQQQAHITVDGIVGPVTWGKLGGGGPQPPTLAQGSEGSVVRKLQTALNEGRGDFAPSSNPVLIVDGSYGPQTATAVRASTEPISGGTGRADRRRDNDGRAGIVAPRGGERRVLLLRPGSSEALHRSLCRPGSGLGPRSP